MPHIFEEGMYGRSGKAGMYDAVMQSWPPATWRALTISKAFTSTKEGKKSTVRTIRLLKLSGAGMKSILPSGKRVLFHPGAYPDRDS